MTINNQANSWRAKSNGLIGQFCPTGSILGTSGIKPALNLPLHLQKSMSRNLTHRFKSRSLSFFSKKLQGGDSWQCWINCQVNECPGRKWVDDTVQQLPSIPAVLRSAAYGTAYRQPEAHTVEHSEINIVRATMIPLHYLHTGPPSHARFLHCPLHCFSVEVVITKANISFSLCHFFLFRQCSQAPSAQKRLK